MSTIVLSWMLTYLLHSTLLLGAAWLAWSLLPREALALKEALWRAALVGGLVTATLQVGLGVEPGIGGWSLGTPAETRPGASAGPPSPGEALAASGRGTEGSSAVPERRPLPEPVAASPPAAAAARDRASDGRTSAGGTGWQPWLLVAWASGAAALVLWLGASCLVLARCLADRRRLAGGRLFSILGRLATAARLPVVELSASARIGSPLAFGWRRREICLPERVAREMPEEQQELVLAHELAHHARRDPAWLIGMRLVESLFFFQPLNRMGRRRLQEIAEYRCDDWAVEQTGRPITLARCLADVAAWNLRRGALLPVPSLARERRRLGRRVARLLDRSYPFPSRRRPRWLAAGVLAGWAAVILLAPGVSSGLSEPPREAPPPPAPPPPAAAVAPAPPVAVVPPAVAPEAPALAPLAPVTIAPASRVAPRVVPAAPSISIEPALAPRPPAAPAPPTRATPATPWASSAPLPPSPAAAPPPPSPRAGETVEWRIEGDRPGLWTPDLEAPPNDELAAIADLVAASSAAIAEFSKSIAGELAAAAGDPSATGWPAELAALGREMDELNEAMGVDSRRLEELARRLAESSRPDPEVMERIGRLSEELGRLSQPGPEAMARIETLTRRLAESAMPDPEKLALYESYVRRAAEDARLSEDERAELRRKRQELLDGARVDREEMARIREQIRRELEAAKPGREEAARLREEIRRELERARPDREELLRSRAEMQAELRRQTEAREEIRRRREEVRRELLRVERQEVDRARARERARQEALDLGDLHAEIERLRAEIERLREELRHRGDEDEDSPR